MLRLFQPVEADGKTNVVGFLNDFAPAKDRFTVWELDFDSDQFLWFDFTAGKQKADIGAQAGDGCIPCLEYAPPASRQVHFDSWSCAGVILHAFVSYKGS